MYSRPESKPEEKQDRIYVDGIYARWNWQLWECLKWQWANSTSSWRTFLLHVSVVSLGHLSWIQEHYFNYLTHSFFLPSYQSLGERIIKNILTEDFQLYLFCKKLESHLSHPYEKKAEQTETDDFFITHQRTAITGLAAALKYEETVSSRQTQLRSPYLEQKPLES